MKRPGAAVDPVQSYLGRLRRRVWVVHGLRAITFAAGISAVLFTAMALTVGPVISMEAAVLAWGLVGAAALVTLLSMLRPLRNLRGARVATLLDTMGSDLASAARSAAELSNDTRAQLLAPELVHAHARRVRAALAEVPPERAVPWRSIGDVSLGIGIAALLVATTLLTSVDRSASGLFALTHPGTHDNTGAAFAAVISEVEARLIFPQYLEREPVVLHDPQVIEAPYGTNIEYSVRPRVRATGGVLQTGSEELTLRPHRDGVLRSSFVVRSNGSLRIRIRDTSGRWLRDRADRALRAIRDAAPRVTLLSPRSEEIIELDGNLVVAYDAQDDVGVRTVELVITGPNGQETRRRLRSVPEDERTQTVSGNMHIAPRELGFKAGDRLNVWVEARDVDIVTGPNIGTSSRSIVTIASEATRRAEQLADLAGLVDAGLDTLAMRLESAVPSDAREAKTRFGRLREQTEVLARGLVSFASARRSAASMHDGGVFRSVANRLNRLLAKEGTLHNPVAATAKRAAINGSAVEELERSVLLLSDLLGRARIDDAAAITRELEQLRRQMASLLAELRRASSPEARQALLQMIARAETRLAELARSLSRMSGEVPTDFANSEALSADRPEQALDALRDAVQRGDTSAAERHLLALERQITAMAQALGSADESFAEARFGTRDRAMAEAMDALTGLEAEQRQLAQRSAEIRRRAAERAEKASATRASNAAERFRKRAASLRRDFQSLPREGLGSLEQESYDRALQRLADSEDALRVGDLGEARRMATEAEEDVAGVARDLDLSALMFPGLAGRTSDAARKAGRVARQLGDLRRELEEAIPSADAYVDARGREQMQQDVRRQLDAARAAGRLAEQFENGPDGAPLSPDAASSMRQVRDSMQRGGRALSGNEPFEAARSQEEAARRLTELRKQLEEQTQSHTESSGGGESGESGGQSGTPDFRRAVRIPSADEFASPTQKRRQLLDAMRERAPSGYEQAVRRYYEELLR